MFRKQVYVADKGDYSAADAGSLNSPTEEASETGHKLKKTLSIFDLVAYGLASTLGTGILVTVGVVANQNSGPAVVFSFLLAGFASFLSALCYSEFAARIPLSGSAYSFTYVALGEVIAWFVGWNLTLEYAISASAVAGGWTSYVVSALNSTGVHVPQWVEGYKTSYELITITPLSALIVLLCTGVLLFGMKESARFNIVMTVINVCILLFFIIGGAIFAHKDNMSPFFPYGASGIWVGVGKVFFSYIGFDAVSTLAGEVRKPARDLPLGILGTLATVTGCYVAVSLVLCSMVPYHEINTGSPLSSAFLSIGKNWMATVIAFGSVTTISATCLTSLVGQPRIFFQMASDGLIFPIFGRVHPKTGVPVFGTVITGIISAIIALFFNLNVLLDMISIGTLLAFTVVCAGVLILRYQEYPGQNIRPWINVKLLTFVYIIACLLFSSVNQVDSKFTSLWVGWEAIIWLSFAVPMVLTFIPFLFLPTTSIPPTFKCPLVPFVPCLAILMNSWFIMSLSIDSIYRLLIWTLIGMSIYFFYGIRNSKLNKLHPSGAQYVKIHS